MSDGAHYEWVRDGHYAIYAPNRALVARALQDVDGYYYLSFDGMDGTYSARMTRLIATVLDEINTHFAPKPPEAA